MTYDVSKCPTCGEYANIPMHTCKPIWKVAIDPSPQHAKWSERPLPDEYRDTHARDGKEAAERFAELYDIDEGYPIVRGECARLWVVSPDGEVFKWEVSGESEPVYRAHAWREGT
jgi:hypothetical protein